MIKTVSTHIILLILVGLTLLPFFFVVINSFRSNSEIYDSFIAFPERIAAATGFENEDRHDTTKIDTEPRGGIFEYYRIAWSVLRGFMLNTILVSGISAIGVTLFGSMTAYVIARYRFMGRSSLYFAILSTMMIPGILTLVPSFLIVKWLGLLNSYGSLILPYIATGQVFAIFVFKEFFEELPEELFEAARLDGAGHFQLYRSLILPLSKPVISVVVVMNILGTWNNFLWPYITNTDDRYHVISSGLYIMANTQISTQMATMFSAYVLSSLPLLLLLIIGTKPFMQGVTNGALKG